MGQKVNPIGFRLGVIRKHNANWYAQGKAYKDNVIHDLKVREFLKTKLRFSSVSNIDLERSAKGYVVSIHTSRPGVIIGKKGEEIENIKQSIQKIVGQPTQVNIKEVKKPDLDATILAEGIAQQLERRVQFRRAMKRAVTAALKAGAEGVRVECSGRLGGAEMGRREWYREGRVPLHTLRADIDFGRAAAHTTVGAIGVKVWVYKGDVVGSNKLRQDKISAEANLASGGPAAGRVKSVKSRAEAAVGEKKEPKILEAGGGKKSSEESSSPGLVEAGGGKKITKEVAQAKFEEEKSILEEE
jgi:small subunit ribosomal protein S3